MSRLGTLPLGEAALCTLLHPSTPTLPLRPLRFVTCAADANLTIADWRGCSDGLGLKVKPKVGDAVLFWSYGPDLALDVRSLHGACPVVRGSKVSMAR